MCGDWVTTSDVKMSGGDPQKLGPNLSICELVRWPLSGEAD